METALVTRIASEDLGFAQWAAAKRAHPHEALCGDGYLIKEMNDGLLICVIDGLGHGREAFTATTAAIEEISEHCDDDLNQLFVRCHQALRTTRGAVMSIASVNTAMHTLSWIGVGNVEGILVKQEKREWLPLRSGIVGCRMPSIQVTSLSLTAGDLLVMYSDGIVPRFLDRTPFHEPPEMVAERIIANHARPTDDAVILVARYHGDGQ